MIIASMGTITNSSISDLPQTTNAMHLTKVRCLRFGTLWSSQAEHRFFKFVHLVHIWFNISSCFVHISIHFLFTFSDLILCRFLGPNDDRGSHNISDTAASPSCSSGLKSPCWLMLNLSSPFEVPFGVLWWMFVINIELVLVFSIPHCVHQDRCQGSQVTKIGSFDD